MVFLFGRTAVISTKDQLEINLIPKTYKADK